MWSSQRPMYRRNRAAAVTPSPAPPLGDLIESITRDSLTTGDGPDRAEISNTRLIASYNWVTSTSPEIMIPGQPPRWTPPKGPQKLRWDDGQYFRDINAASYPKHPLEPTVVSVMKMNPDPLPVNIVACGSTLGNLLRFARGVDEDRSFRILVELVGDTVHLIRRENSAKELIPGIRGYGHTFPETYTTWDMAVRRSKSHQRIMAYRFGGLDMMVRFEGDGFIREAKPLRRGNSLKPADAVAGIQNLGITQPSPAGGSELKVKTGGENVPQESVFDLKTRSVMVRDRDTLGTELPRLWIARVTQFVLAYHEKGLFREEDINIKDVKDDVDEWEELNQPHLKRLIALLHLVIDRARTHGKLELVRSNSGPLEIRQQLPDAGDVLSATVRKDWEVWLGEKDRSDDVREKRDPKMETTDFLDALPDSDGEASDYAACDQECGYCGKCAY
ncbi:hypothetical protein ACJ41O_003300 [Fusarium nematophilum]